MNDPQKATSIYRQHVAFSSSYFSAAKQRYAQTKTGKLTTVHAFRKFDQLFLGKSRITVHSHHKPLENIFKRSNASASRHLQSMMLTLQRRSFSLKYRWDLPPTLLTPFLVYHFQK